MASLHFLFILLLILFAEIFILIYLLISLVLNKIISYFVEKYKNRLKSFLEKKVLACLQNQTSLHTSFPKTLTMVLVLEQYDWRIQGAEWERLKKYIVVHFLEQKAKRWSKSFFFTRKNYAARTFRLMPSPEYEPYLLDLLEDPSFLVSSIAASALIRISSRQGMKRALEIMTMQKGYGYYFYKDLLLQAPIEGYKILVEKVLKSANEKDDLAVLDIFSEKTIPCPLPFLEKDLKSKNEELVLQSLKALEKNRTENAENIFRSFLSHPNEKLRAQATRGIGLYANPENKETLKKMLHDTSWKVRYEAAVTLKFIGEEGFLQNLLQNPDPNLSMVAKYVIEFA